MDLVSQESLLFHIQVLVKKDEGSFLFGLMNLEAGLNIVNRRTKHIVYAVSCSGTVVAGKKLVTRHLF